MGKYTHRSPIAFAIIATALGIEGCASTPGRCDPAKEDFFNNTSCLATGGYEQREQNLASELAVEQRRNQAFRTMLAELDAQQAAVGHTRRERERELARVNSAWDDLEQDLRADSNHNAQLQGRIQQIENDLAQLADPGIARKAEQRDTLMQQVILLQQELAAGVYE